MSSTFRTISSKTVVALLIYALVAAGTLVFALKLQLGHLAVDEQAALGDALSTQLAENIRPMLVDNDVISMQVILDNLVTRTAQVGRASVYDSANQLLAQSQAALQPGEPLSRHATTIAIDDTLNGQIRIELRTNTLATRYSSLFWSILGAWGIATLLLAIWLVATAMRFSRQVARINARLVSTPAAADNRLDELVLLEKRLAPLLNDGSCQQPLAQERRCILAVDLANLPRLRAQLNSDHFNSILDAIDQQVERAKNLFRGERLHGGRNAILIQFSTLASGEEHLLQAVSCGAALTTLCRELEQDETLPLELRLAIAPLSPPDSDSRWGADLYLEDTIEHLLTLLRAANPWQLLIDQALITDDELSFCDTDPLPSAPAQLFRGFTPSQYPAHERQVDFLRGRQRPTPALLT
ncbi:MAG: hypothetical protein WC247_04260 [Porticoccaceae bacterium]|jgi:uncharacterized membrane protein affecting hemolysin expression